LCGYSNSNNNKAKGDGNNGGNKEEPERGAGRNPYLGNTLPAPFLLGLLTFQGNRKGNRSFLVWRCFLFQNALGAVSAPHTFPG